MLPEINLKLSLLPLPPLPKNVRESAEETDGLIMFTQLQNTSRASDKMLTLFCVIIFQIVLLWRQLATLFVT